MYYLVELLSDIDSEPRLIKVVREVKFDRTEMSTIRWMCWFIWKERKKKQKCGAEEGCVSLVIRDGRLEWF